MNDAHADFDFDFNPGIDRALIKDLAACRLVCILIAGLLWHLQESRGAGHIGHYAVRTGIDVMFTSQT